MYDFAHKSIIPEYFAFRAHPTTVEVNENYFNFEDD
jgi:hypothetical protein